MSQAAPAPVGPDERVDADVSPRGSLELLSQLEVDVLRRVGHGSTHDLLRRCALAVLNTGSDLDDAAAIFDRYHDFDIEIVQRTRGMQLRVSNAPANAFVDGEMLEGIKEHLFAVVRDVVYIATEIGGPSVHDLDSSAGITNAVFHILRNARAFSQRDETDLVVCWGGHAIGPPEYDYTKEVGYQLGLRGLSICTGCGPGAMKGPMKGAAVGHAKQRDARRRFLGISEPGIIAAEPPNPIVRELVILPDIEKRLEAFVRLAHTFIVFPGGVGTAEEILYLLGIMMHPDNDRPGIPLILTGPTSSAAWFERVEALIVAALGERARGYYQIHLGDPVAVARAARRGVDRVREIRLASGDAFYFNWLLRLPYAFQQPFSPTHASMADLELRRDRPPSELAADLRRAFSGIVAGNVKESGIRAVRQHGPWALHAERELLEPLDALLESFVGDGRMRLSGDYVPCYRLVA